MKNINKTTKLAVRLEPREKKLLNYYATRLGLSSSALVRNQIKTMLQELEEEVANFRYVNMTKISSLTGPTYSQEEIKELFAVK
ncbi:MAG: hypothetical protein WCJ58_03655 [bacterium]